MEKILVMLFSVMSALILASCGISKENAESKTATQITSQLSEGSAEASVQEEISMNKIKITAGDKSFTAVLYDNDAANAFDEMLPLTLDMSELNGNEKYFYLSDNLPVNSERPDKINSGDIMLYGSGCVVLFYDTFDTSYSYTRLGYIEDASGLSTVLGSGDVRVTFEKE
ncbi:MAG: hypothetical protein HDT21_04275 [Ruminococcus sp.]|nr:hypothetical protein [Ruminococcus sp.]